MTLHTFSLIILCLCTIALGICTINLVVWIMKWRTRYSYHQGVMDAHRLLLNEWHNNLSYRDLTLPEYDAEMRVYERIGNTILNYVDFLQQNEYKALSRGELEGFPFQNRRENDA